MRALLIAAIIVTAAGMISTLFGSLFKLQHLPGAGMLLTSGLLIQVAGVILLAIYFVRKSKSWQQ